METFKKQEELKSYFQTAYGYAVFPHIAKGGFGIGGAVGQGTVYKNNKDGTETKIGESNMVQVSFGFQVGGQVYSEIIFFESEKDFEHFTSGNFEFGADANVVALTASASAKATTMGNQGLTTGMTPDNQNLSNFGSYTKGMAVFSVVAVALIYKATIGGQKFTYKEAS